MKKQSLLSHLLLFLCSVTYTFQISSNESSTTLFIPKTVKITNDSKKTIIVQDLADGFEANFSSQKILPTEQVTFPYNREMAKNKVASFLIASPSSAYRIFYTPVKNNLASNGYFIDSSEAELNFKAIKKLSHRDFFESDFISCLSCSNCKAKIWEQQGFFYQKPIAVASMNSWYNSLKCAIMKKAIIPAFAKFHNS